MIKALIDGDWILYAAGFAGQKTGLVCPSIFGAREFGTMTELRTAVYEEEDGKHDPEADPVYKRDILDPESHFYHSAKMMIERNCETVAEKLKRDVTPVVLIDGDGNFRTRLASIRPYKGTRSVHAKPLMYNNIRDYLLTAWDAEVVHEQETDDEMAIRQSADPDNTIIMSIDKDMLQVPGWHMNPSKGFKKISTQEGLWRLYVQCIQGDTVDNIAGATSFGAKRARDLIPRKATAQEMWALVLKAFEKKPDTYNGLTPEEAAIENMRLVYLRRTPGEIWMPPEG